MSRAQPQLLVILSLVAFAVGWSPRDGAAQLPPPPWSPARATSAERLAGSVEMFNLTLDLLEDVADVEWVDPTMRVPISFVPALVRDLRERAEAPAGLSLLSARTLEQLGQFGLDVLPAIVERAREAGRLSPSFRVPSTLYGADDFVRAAATHAGGRGLTVDAITLYLDGLSKATAAVAGGLVGGPSGAKAAETAAGWAQTMFRAWTMPLFRRPWNGAVQRRMLQDWSTAQESRIARGLPVQSLSEMFTPEGLAAAGFTQEQVDAHHAQSLVWNDTWAAGSRALLVTDGGVGHQERTDLRYFLPHHLTYRLPSADRDDASYDTSPEQVRREVYGLLETYYTHNPNGRLELRVIADVRLFGYLTGSEAQRRSYTFATAVHEAVAQYRADHGIERVDVYAGSNGGNTQSHAIVRSAAVGRVAVDKIWYEDAQTRIEVVRDVREVLGPGGVGIVAVEDGLHGERFERGDLVAAPANAERLVASFPDIEYYLFDPPGSADHIYLFENSHERVSGRRYDPVDGYQAAGAARAVDLVTSRWPRESRDAETRSTTLDGEGLVPSLWATERTGARPADARHEARMLPALVPEARRAVVFGGPAAAETYGELTRRIGADNVVWFDDVPHPSEQQRIARRLRAEAILGVRPEVREPPPPGRERCGAGGDTCPLLPSRSDPFLPPRPLGPAAVVDRDEGFRQPSGGGGAVASPAISRFRSDVGGVMLGEPADVAGDASSVVQGDFSLLFTDPTRGVDVRTLRKFVTAAWAVYFGDEGPGISLDPSPVPDVHVVRYIGQVRNLDIARIMRLADYLMKKWAVGVEAPDIPGFKSVDRLQAERGLRHLNASRRFWFVPDSMRFQVVGDAIVFRSGRMKLNTEYVGRGSPSAVEPADAAFAEFFTERYDEIATKYPVFAELFEYAQLVSLARHLKDRGVPLLWFLLANKDLVITEDSQPTVEAFAKQSEYVERIEIRGGVDLAQPLEADNYVTDDSATDDYATHDYATRADGPLDHTPAPARSLTLTSGSGGARFRTDVALRLDGAPGLELVRYRDEDRTDPSDFGPGWYYGLPYEIEPASDSTIAFLNAVIPQRMRVINLLTGRREELGFSEDRYPIAGYVPDVADESGLVGLFLLSDGSYRLADKVGSEFAFDPTGRLVEMVLTEDHVTGFGYERRSATGVELGREPYRLEPGGAERVEVRGVTLPRRLDVHDIGLGASEVFLHDDGNDFGVIGYTPADASSRHSFLAVMTDGSFVLHRRDGGQVSFDPAGRFRELSSRVLASVTSGDHRVSLERELADGAFRVSRALVETLDGEPLRTIRYEYGGDGRLVGAHTESADAGAAGAPVDRTASSGPEGR